MASTPVTSRVLAHAHADLAPGRWYDVRIEAAGPRLRLWTDGANEPILDVTDPNPLTEPGSPGVRAWGASVVVQQMNGHVRRAGSPAPGRRRRPRPPGAAGDAVAVPIAL